MPNEYASGSIATTTAPCELIRTEPATAFFGEALLTMTISAAAASITI